MYICILSMYNIYIVYHIIITVMILMKGKQKRFPCLRNDEYYIKKDYTHGLHMCISKCSYT